MLCYCHMAALPEHCLDKQRCRASKVGDRVSTSLEKFVWPDKCLGTAWQLGGATRTRNQSKQRACARTSGTSAASRAAARVGAQLRWRPRRAAARVVWCGGSGARRVRVCAHAGTHAQPAEPRAMEVPFVVEGLGRSDNLVSKWDAAAVRALTPEVRPALACAAARPSRRARLHTGARALREDFLPRRHAPRPALLQPRLTADDTPHDARWARQGGRAQRASPCGAARSAAGTLLFLPFRRAASFGASLPALQAGVGRSASAAAVKRRRRGGHMRS